MRPNQVGLMGAGGQGRQMGVQLHALDGQEIELLLDFPLHSAEPLEAAFLVLSSVQLPPTGNQLIRLRVARIIDPWSPDALEKGHSPQLGYETVSGLIHESQQARIDVTDLVRPWMENPEHSFGFAVTSPDPSQLVLALDGRSGEPFLELYTKAKGTRN